ncbi:AAA family ATPase [Phenylobacterium sp. VNQ135]|uniref:AAA family ATPase n=1 Tax=Phenylobacterium sp. VNQ135 TaxID=3400922 RepID=UPI003C0A9921
MTGAPGAGKTTLLRHLTGLGHKVAPESARAVIQTCGGRPEPERFCELILQQDLSTYAAASGLTFFDRTLVDAWATFRAYGLAPSPAADDAVRAHRYAPRAFIAPPWKAIYVQDAERDQTWPEAVRAYEACAAAYLAQGYELVELPLADVETRAAFVLDATA